MKRRRTLTIAGLVILAVFLVVFVVFGIPFIQATFSTPVPGLPTTDPNSGSISLKDRYTQTALAKQNGARIVATATAAP
jgi:hypothetical protein